MSKSKYNNRGLQQNGVNAHYHPERGGKAKRYDPALRSALYLLAPFLLFKLVAVFLLPDVGEVLLWILLILHVILYFVVGLLSGGWFQNTILQSKRIKTQTWLQRQTVAKGAAAGLTLSIGGWLVFALILIVISLFPQGEEVALYGASMALVGLVEIFAALLLSALGGLVAIRK